MKEPVLLEICCGSAQDAIDAFGAGAHRVELNCALALGGLSPSAGTLKKALEGVEIPVICMVRPRPGGFCYAPGEFDSMVYDAANFVSMGAAGVAFGCLTPEGRIDVPRCRRMVEAVGEGEAVFHRAFDALTQPLEEALDILADLGVRRVLTSGQRPTALEGAEVIRRCREYAAGRLELLPGGGVRPHNAREILEKTGCRQLHGTFHKDARDRSASQNPHMDPGAAAPPPPGDNVRVIDKAGLRAFEEALGLL